MSLQHSSLALLMATAMRWGARYPADFIRFPVRIGGVWHCEVRR